MTKEIEIKIIYKIIRMQMDYLVTCYILIIILKINNYCKNCLSFKKKKVKIINNKVYLINNQIYLINNQIHLINNQA
jgi:conjugal transfer/entry exclusion protein